MSGLLEVIETFLGLKVYDKIMMEQELLEYRGATRPLGKASAIRQRFNPNLDPSIYVKVYMLS